MADQRNSTFATSTPLRDSSGRFKKAPRPPKHTAQQHQVRHQNQVQVQQDKVVPPSSPSAPSYLPIPDDQHLSVDETEEEQAFFLERIQSAIDYTKSQLAHGLPILQTTRFSVHLSRAEIEAPAAHVTALSLLRSSPAIVVYSSDAHEVFELGIPNPYMVPESAGHTLVNDPQWWVGKSAAEVKAGPFADEEDLRKAQAKLKEVETKKRKRNAPTQKQTNIDWKLAEGLRRQDGGLEMFDANIEGEDAECEDVEGEDVEGATFSEDEGEDEEEAGVYYENDDSNDDEDEMEF